MLYRLKCVASLLQVKQFGPVTEYNQLISNRMILWFLLSFMIFILINI